MKNIKFKNDNNLKKDLNDELNLKLLIGLSRTNLRLSRKTQELLYKYKITITQFGVMEALYHIGDLKVGEITEKILSTSGNMTVVIKNLEKEGYIEKYVCEEDKRASMIHISEKGRDLIEQIFPEHLKDLEQSFSKLEEEDKKVLIKLLKQLNGV